MNPSEDLHQLIRSMNMSEKRHFKIHSSRHVIGDGNNYRHLFDAIARQENYDEREIKNSFHGKTFIKHLPSEKHYLYHHILESLNSFGKEKTFLARHANLLISIEILFNRGLFAQCKKLIAKAKKEAYSLEKLSVLLVIVRFETLIYIKDEDDVNLNANINEELRILEMMRTQYALMQVAFNIQIQIDKGKITPAFVRSHKIALKKNLPKRKETDSFWAEYYFHSGIALLSAHENKQLLRYSSYKEIKKIMDNAPQFIVDLPGIYHLNLNNLVNEMFLLKKFDEAEILIKQQREFIPSYGIKRPTISKMVFLNTYESELFLYYKTGRTSKAVAVIREIESDVKKVELSFSPVLFDLFYMMAVAELVAKNYKSATKWLNRILNAERENYFRKELQINSRLLFLIVLFETDDVLLDNRLNSAKRFIAQEPQFKTQQKILEVIKFLSEDSSRKKRKAALGKYVSEIRKEQKKLNVESLNKQFDFAEWIEGKLQGEV
jgi:hypothetical protein